MNTIAAIVGILLAGLALEVARRWPTWSEECDGNARRESERRRNGGTGQ